MSKNCLALVSNDDYSRPKGSCRPGALIVSRPSSRGTADILHQCLINSMAGLDYLLLSGMLTWTPTDRSALWCKDCNSKHCSTVSNFFALSELCKPCQCPSPLGLAQCPSRSGTKIGLPTSGPGHRPGGPMLGYFKEDRQPQVQTNSIRPLIAPEEPRIQRAPERIKTEFRPAEHDRELLARQRELQDRAQRGRPHLRREAAAM